MKIKLKAEKAKGKDRYGVGLFLIVLPFGFYMFVGTISLVLEYFLSMVGFRGTGAHSPAWLNFKYIIAPILTIIGVFNLIYRWIKPGYLTNYINCNYCEKELNVSYPKENIECSKCKTLHVIDWE